MIQQAMIFAAGLGTRMGELTKSTPKPLLKIGDQALIDHAIGLLRGSGIKNIIVNAHYHAEQIVAHLDEQPDIKIIVEAPGILETGGGLKNALPHFDTGPILTMNSDLFFIGKNPIPALIDRWDTQTMDALLLLVSKGNAHAHLGPGDFDMPSPPGPITRRTANEANYIFTGAQIIKPDSLQDILEPAFSISRLWAAYQQRLFGMATPSNWVDVGHPDGLTIANQLAKVR